eukprot:366067-Chlamydomonas_euryale.AAC.12
MHTLPSRVRGWCKCSTESATPTLCVLKGRPTSANPAHRRDHCPKIPAMGVAPMWAQTWKRGASAECMGPKPAWLVG